MVQTLELGNWEAGELGSWGTGKLGNWEAVELRNEDLRTPIGFSVPQLLSSSAPEFLSS
jgi:hypothetical protein